MRDPARLAVFACQGRHGGKAIHSSEGWHCLCLSVQSITNRFLDRVGDAFIANRHDAVNNNMRGFSVARLTRPCDATPRYAKFALTSSGAAKTKSSLLKTKKTTSFANWN